MISYRINTIDEEGLANVDVTLGEQVFNQNLLLPTEPTALDAKMQKYVRDYADGLAAASTTPALLQPLIGVEKAVEVSAATREFVEANYVTPEELVKEAL